MRIAEEILLLLLNEDSGYFHPIANWNLSCVTAGALLADLALENRLRIDSESLTCIDETTTGDELLDGVLQEISGEPTQRNTQYWVECFAHRSEFVIESLLGRLVERGILDHDEGGYWSLNRSVARSRRYAGTDGTLKTEVRSRIPSALFEDHIPSPQDAILIDLANACEALRHLMPVEDYEEVKDRIDLIGNIDLNSRMIAEAVRAASLQVPPAQIADAEEIPRVGMWRIVRNRRAFRHLRRGNISRLMAELYRAHGAVVRVKVPLSKHESVILVGQETNRWFHTQGRHYLRSKEHIRGLEDIFGASRTLPGMDGAEHFRLRKAVNAGYSRTSLENRLEQVYLHCRSSLRTWQAGGRLNGASACRTLMSRQVSHLAAQVDTSEYIEDVLDYQQRVRSVRVMRALPEIALRTPAMKRKRKRLMELVNKIHAAHTPGSRMDSQGDLIDEYLRVHSDDPQFLPRTELNFYVLATLMPSIYLGNALAFALSTMTSHPDVYERIKAEGDALFAEGNPAAQDFTPAAVDTAYRLFMETQRLFPVIPMQIRHVMNPCIIEGFEIPVGTRLLIAQTGTHFLEEHFHDPLRFDIDRFLPEREAALEKSVYAPFGLGTHRCLGARWADLQMVVNILLIAHHLELRSHPSSYDLKIDPVPSNAPNKHFSITVKEVRHGFPEPAEEG